LAELYTASLTPATSGKLHPDVGAFQNNLDMNELEDRDFRSRLINFAIIYFLIGVFEVELRRKMKITLSVRAEKLGNSQWYEGLPLSKKGAETLEKALKVLERRARFQGEEVEDLLPLSFWRYLLTARNFTQLWIPTLVHLFPALNNPENFGVFQIIDNRMSRLLRLRNRVAHYNLNQRIIFPEEIANIYWLLAAMGVKLVEA